MLSAQEANYIIDRCKQQQRSTGKQNALVNFQIQGVHIGTKVGDVRRLYKDGPDGVVVGFIGSEMLDVQFNADKLIYSIRVYLDNMPKPKPKGRKRR